MERLLLITITWNTLYNIIFLKNRCINDYKSKYLSVLPNTSLFISYRIYSIRIFHMKGLYSTFSEDKLTNVYRLQIENKIYHFLRPNTRWSTKHIIYYTIWLCDFIQNRQFEFDILKIVENLLRNSKRNFFLLIYFFFTSLIRYEEWKGKKGSSLWNTVEGSRNGRCVKKLLNIQNDSFHSAKTETAPFFVSFHIIYEFTNAAFERSSSPGVLI